MNISKKKVFILIICTVTLLICTVAYAYLTSYVTIVARKTVVFSDDARTAINTEVTQNQNGYSITYDIGNSSTNKVYIRVKPLVSENVTYQKQAGTGWTENADGYLYYQNPVSAGGSASEVTINYTGFTEVTPKKVLLAVESIRASYSADDVSYADWNIEVSSSS